MPPLDKGLLPKKSDLESFTDEQVRGTFALVEAQGRRAFIYSIYGMTCGFLSFLASLAVCFQLGREGHEGAAGLVMGAAILSSVGSMIQGRKTE